MRKIYSLVVLLVALLTSSVVASAANVTFKTPDPSKVTIGWRQYYSGTPDPLEWNSGDFTYDLSDGYIVIKPVAGYEFVTTTATLNGGPVSYPSFPAEGEEFALASYYVTEGDVYYFETQVMKIKQATLKVDDYTHISVNNGGEAVDLTSNEMTLDKPAGTYARLEVNASDEYLLSSVKVAGEEKLSTPNVESWNAYWSDFSDGAVIEIATTERPAKTLNIKADPEFVVVKYLDTEVEATDVSGVKTFVVPNVAKNKYVEIFAREGYALEGLRNEDRTDEEYMMTGAVYTNISEYSMKYGDNNYSVGTYNKESRRTAKFKITVDQPENLYIKRNADFKAMTNNNEEYLVPEAGVETEYGINLTAENPVDIRPRVYGTKIYRVQKRAQGSEEWIEVTKPSYYDNFSVTVADGDEIKVDVAYPDIDLNVTFTAPAGQTFDPATFAYVDIDGTRYRASRVTDEGSTVKFGSSMNLYPHTKLFTLSGVTANGNYVYAWSSLNYEFTKNEDVEFCVTAAKASTTYNVTLKVDNPEALLATYNTSVWDPNLLIDLTSGEATLEMANDEVLYYHNTPNFTIKSARIVREAGSETDADDLTNERSVKVNENLVIEFTTEVFERNEQLIVYADDDSWTENEITFSYTDDPIRQYNKLTYVPEVGRNVLNYNAELDLPVYLHILDNIRNEDYTYTKTFPFVYINGVRTECPLNDDGYTYNHLGYPGLDEFPNNSVLKIFRNEPALYEVSFKLGDGVEVNDVITDEITKVEDLSEPLSLLQNTSLSFALPALENERQSYVMTLNDEEVEVPEDGKFSYTVDGNKAFDISIYTEPEQGITNVNGDAAANTNVYNLQGILMIRNASKEQISNLPEGLYIVGDKKVIIK